jgi:hypothetical protein
VLGFDPTTIVTSSKLRAGGKVDLVLRLANQNRFMFLINIGDGRFRPAIDRGGFFDGAGDVASLLIGDVNSDGLDDIITFDRDMTLRIFQNTGAEGFTAAAISNPLGNKGFRFAIARYIVADFGDGKPGLAAAALGKIQTPEGEKEVTGLAVLKGDGGGGFTIQDNFTQFSPPQIGADPATTFKTDFALSPVAPGAERIEDHQIVSGFAGQFRNSLQGNNKPDLGIVSIVSTESTAPQACASDPRDPPSPPRVCRPLEQFDFCPPGRRCTDPDAPCCFCPGVGQCPHTCSSERPRIPFCQTTREYWSLAVYGNTCGG